MNTLIQRYGALTYILFFQTLLFLVSFFFKLFKGDVLFLALNPDVTTFIHRPWTLFTFLFLPNLNFIGFLFDLLWVFYFGILLRDFRKDWFIWLAYLLSVIMYACFAVGMNWLFPHQPLWKSPIFGAMIGNFTILCLVAILIPNFRIPLFFLGAIPVKWIVLGYGLLGILFSNGKLLFPYLIAFSSALLFVKTEFLYALADSYQSFQHYIFSSSQKDSIQELEEEVNRILDKIAKKGIKSLTRKERKLLDKYRQYIDSK